VFDAGWLALVGLTAVVGLIYWLVDIINKRNGRDDQ
jgi:hypothetical protein